MFASKGAQVLRAFSALNGRTAIQNSVRNSGHACNYRCAGPPAHPKVIMAAEFVGGFAWWWVLWHLWTEPGHITGEFEFPDASKWTNQELGIPEE
ncbi:PREDICTED: NADH dehydrogenase [ubiquinone] 1 beta subcomplex subunit 2, mitochondrial-like [Nicrophorus vespilloides]|uniref:NADH dehydrogenase [ubiquinone] 1 beta subcomplex subunit 2, mitochondrial-like n=1 Tax=Nicrophorus vespilloides TaxID=110193 RepID=A0ABM1N724_NICVS|nr:PREDICTED: NADH dehydrogenase [ubiquinone] 1 beta subcomplex subunit 2, mitochondrial-like [Nicrophorus vespilloides]